MKFEQKGRERAEYGKSLLNQISIDLSQQYGKGLSVDNLEMMRKLYSAYPVLTKSETLSSQSEIPQAVAAKLPLSWSHYCLLMRIDEPFKREFYETECLQGNWSVRQLDRQIQPALYERTILSKCKLAVDVSLTSYTIFYFP